MDATSDLVGGRESNLAFYQAMGIRTLRAPGDKIAFIIEEIPAKGDAMRTYILSPRLRLQKFFTNNSLSTGCPASARLQTD